MLNDRKIRVLVVDDEPELRRIFSIYFEREGCEVIQAFDGSMAWGMLTNGVTFDLVVSDNTMPGMTGLDLLKRMRKYEETKSIPFVMLSGDALQSEVEKLELASFYPKPSPRAIVREILEKFR